MLTLSLIICFELIFQFKFGISYWGHVIEKGNLLSSASSILQMWLSFPFLVLAVVFLRHEVTNSSIKASDIFFRYREIQIKDISQVKLSFDRLFYKVYGIQKYPIYLPKFILKSSKYDAIRDIFLNLKT